MMYSRRLKQVCETDITDFGKSCQGDFFDIVKKDYLAEFPGRLLSLYEGRPKGDIAADLKIPASTVTKLLSGEQPPKAEWVIRISEIRNCSTDWLLKGEGEEPAEPYGFLSDSGRQVVEKLAEIEGQDVDAVLNELVTEGLGRRAADLFANLKRLNARERKQVRALLALVESEEVQEAEEAGATKLRSNGSR
jgi:transcriptional regulator with XRE-family HTH domain